MLTMLTNMPRDVLVAQIYDGLVLLVLGMGTVFIFLVILIFATKLMSRIVNGISKDHQSSPAPSAAPVQAAASVQVQQKAAPAPQGDDAAVAAAIAAAYDRSRN